MMLPTLLAAAFSLGNALTSTAPANPHAVAQAAASSCSTAGPAVTGATVRSVTRNGDLNHYVIAIQVTNTGRSTQPGNTLQSVDVLQNDVKVDQKGVLPLRPGQTTTVTYAFDRAVEAASGTTQFVFRLHDCSYAFAV